jgi:hypothetical protein
VDQYCPAVVTDLVCVTLNRVAHVSGGLDAEFLPERFLCNSGEEMVFHKVFIPVNSPTSGSGFANYGWRKKVQPMEAHPTLAPRSVVCYYAFAINKPTCHETLAELNRCNHRSVQRLYGRSYTSGLPKARPQ